MRTHLSGDANRTRVEVTLAHHNAPNRDERRRGKAELLGAGQRRLRHVSAGAQLAYKGSTNVRSQFLSYISSKHINTRNILSNKVQVS